MALKKTIALPVSVTKTDAFGDRLSSESATYADCYIKVESVTGSKDTQAAKVSFKREDGAKFFRDYDGLPVDLEGGNNIAQAYQALKALPEFSGAEDV